MAEVGLVAGLFSAFLWSKDDRFWKWWEMRGAAYQAVIDALSDLTTAYKVRFQAELNGPTQVSYAAVDMGSLLQKSGV